MRIGVIGHPQSPHTAKWASALQRAGADVVVFSFVEGRVPGVETVRVRPPWGLGRRLTYLWYLGGGRRLRGALAAAEVDLVNPLGITPYGVWAERAGVRPIVSVAMGSDVLAYDPDPDPALWERNMSDRAFRGTRRDRLRFRARRLFHRRTVRRALHASALVTGDNLVLVQATESWFGLPPARTRLNRWGVEPDLLAPPPERLAALRERFGIRPGQPVVASPRGVLPPYQGDVILEAFARLIEYGSEARFLFFSNGQRPPPALAARIEEVRRRHDAFVYVDPALDREAMLGLWPIIDVFVSAPVYDGYSNAVAEGRYVGAVPVVNATPATAEILEDGVTGWFVDPFTPDHLASALRTILQDLPRWKAHFAPANRRWIEAHSLLAPNARAFVDDCERVLAAARRP